MNNKYLIQLQNKPTNKYQPSNMAEANENISYALYKVCEKHSAF